MRKILVAYDGGDPARHALATAAELARATGAAVGIISVVPTYAARGGPRIEPWDDKHVHEDELLDARRILEERGIEPELIEVVGSPAATIEAVAARDGYDTIVVGRRHLGLFRRLVEDRVSEHVLDHTESTVVVTH